MEKEIKISIPQKKFIYGRLRGFLKWPLVVFVHGLGGIMDQHIYYNGSRYLEKRGFSSFRFNLYGWEKNARKLGECTLQTHASDLDRVIKYFREKGAKKLCVIGHSFGGPAILMSKNKNFDCVVFWDPSYDVPLSFQNARYLKALDTYVSTWNFDVVLNKKMIEGSQILKQKEEELIQQIHVPIKIICAGKGWLARGGRRYFALAAKPKEFVIIKNAGHTFDENGVEEKLFTETFHWLKKYI